MDDMEKHVLLVCAGNYPPAMEAHPPKLAQMASTDFASLRSNEILVSADLDDGDGLPTSQIIVLDTSTVVPLQIDKVLTPPFCMPARVPVADCWECCDSGRPMARCSSP